MLLIFGTQDPHISEHDRHTIINALENAKVHHLITFLLMKRNILL
jgi:carboxymethylenebutenolidase